MDEKTAPPKSPADSLACLEIEPGLEIQLVASEPLVKDPVAITFDQRGRMFVVEYGDYPIGPEDGGDPLSKVVYLEDSDGDGQADQRHVFADKLTFAHSLMPFRDGLIVGAQTQILFLKDTDGDNVADVREVLFDGFTPAHPQMQIGNPRWGMDNWVYLNYGPGNITSPRSDAKPVDMPRKDFRFNPLTMEFEADSGMGQFGNTVDRWGNRFYCTNRNPIMTTLLPPEILNRNPYAITAAASYDVGTSGGDTRVYPLVEMKSNYLSHAGTHTSACGVTAYTGDLLKGTFQDSVFVCEPIGHLVTRSIIKPDGLRLTAERARPKADFIASTGEPRQRPRRSPLPRRHVPLVGRASQISAARNRCQTRLASGRGPRSDLSHRPKKPETRIVHSAGNCRRHGQAAGIAERLEAVPWSAIVNGALFLCKKPLTRKIRFTRRGDEVETSAALKTTHERHNSPARFVDFTGHRRVRSARHPARSERRRRTRSTRRGKADQSVD
ncbi:MAG: hypothetical protein O2983_11440 [Planctomycetota bacterium]|nr:hypothetical protein [Planctomycetota bacterium]